MERNVGLLLPLVLMDEAIRETKPFSTAEGAAVTVVRERGWSRLLEARQDSRGRLNITIDDGGRRSGGLGGRSEGSSAAPGAILAWVVGWSIDG
jgi:hypothetical protein